MGEGHEEGGGPRGEGEDTGGWGGLRGELSVDRIW